MQPDTYAILGFMMLLGGGFAAFFWRFVWHQFDGIAHQFEEVRGDLKRIENQLADCAKKEDLNLVRAEVASLRSDVTQVALAIGVRGQRASEV